MDIYGNSLNVPLIRKRQVELAHPNVRLQDTVLTMDSAYTLSFPLAVAEEYLEEPYLTTRFAIAKSKIAPVMKIIPTSGSWSACMSPMSILVNAVIPTYMRKRTGIWFVLK
jgi:hypothetical protein